MNQKFLSPEGSENSNLGLMLGMALLLNQLDVCAI